MIVRPQVTYVTVERGLRKVVRTYQGGRRCVRWQVRLVDAAGAGKARFADVADHWLASRPHLTQRSRQSDRLIIGGKLTALHDVRVDRLDYDTLVAFQARLAGEGLAPSTQRRMMSVVRAVCADARRRRLIAADPCVDLPTIKCRRPQLRPPEPDEVERLISHLASVPTRQDTGLRWSLLVETAAFSGLRAGELAALRVRDFSVGKRALHVTRALPTGSTEQTVPKTDAGIRTVDDLDPGLSSRLSAHATNLRPDDFLFGWLDRGGVSRPYRHENFYRRTFKPACRHLDLQIRFHDLRHFPASLLIDAGLTPVEVAARLGHTSPIFTLDTYAHLFRKESTGLGDLIATRRAEARGQNTSRHAYAAQRCASRRRGSGGSRTHPRGRRRTTVDPSAERLSTTAETASAGQRW